MKKVRIKDEAQVAISFVIIFMVITCTIIFVVYNSFNIRTLLLVSIVFICSAVSILKGIEIKIEDKDVKQNYRQ